MSQSITIARRFNGPPASANGGYTCGVTAQALRSTAQVSLKIPPPIEQQLSLDASGESATLAGSDGSLVAEAVPAELNVTAPEPVTFDEASDAAARFDVDAFRAVHYFPGCFTCGPDRTAGDGLRLFPGKVDRDEAITAWPWTPDDSLPGDSRGIDPVIMWAALDCPSGWAWYHERDPSPHVLGRLAAEIYRPAAPGERTVVAGWPIAIEGRKERSASAIWSADGELLALGQATWIELTEEQFGQFRVAVS